MRVRSLDYQLSIPASSITNCRLPITNVLDPVSNRVGVLQRFHGEDNRGIGNWQSQAELDAGALTRLPTINSSFFDYQLPIADYQCARSSQQSRRCPPA